MKQMEFKSVRLVLNIFFFQNQFQFCFFVVFFFCHTFYSVNSRTGLFFFPSHNDFPSAVHKGDSDSRLLHAVLHLMSSYITSTLQNFMLLCLLYAKFSFSNSFKGRIELYTLLSHITL